MTKKMLYSLAVLSVIFLIGFVESAFAAKPVPIPTTKNFHKQISLNCDTQVDFFAPAWEGEVSIPWDTDYEKLVIEHVSATFAGHDDRYPYYCEISGQTFGFNAPVVIESNVRMFTLSESTNYEAITSGFLYVRCQLNNDAYVFLNVSGTLHDTQ